MNKIILIHYHEIALKGRNRPFFERALLENIKKSLASCALKKAQIVFGRIVLQFESEVDELEIKKCLSRVFGIANFSFGWELSSDFSKFSEEIVEILKEEHFNTFRVTAKRAGKDFPMSSQEINEQLGMLIVQKLGKKVDLENYDLNCFIEIVNGRIFFYTQKETGLGGLPVGVSGSVLTLLSSGFDSPVAAWQMMRRGCRVDFAHFHSYPMTSKESQENVREIVKVLNQYQFSSKLYLVPFLDIQKEITEKSDDASQRVVLYRRFMMRIAQKIAEREKYGALVTGDSLGQVASQTLENISVISQAVHPSREASEDKATLPIFRPLIGTNKEDIIDTSKQIGTYEISSRPYDDCCSLFLPEHPETRAKLDVILEIERKLEVEKLTHEAIDKTDTFEV